MVNTPMRRVPRAELPDDLKPIWDQAGQYFDEPVAIEVLGNHPELAHWYFQDFYANAFHNMNPAMTVDRRTKELLRLRFSKQHGCALCNRGNEVAARDIGFTDAQIDALLDPVPARALFTAKEHAVIAFADQMMLHNMDGILSPQLYAQMKAHFDDKQIMELGMVGAVLVGMAKMMFVFNIVPHETNCPFPQVRVTAQAAE